MQSKLILYLVAQDYEDLEFWVPLMRLQEEGHTIVLAGKKEKEPYTGKNGIVAVTDISFDNANPNEFDAVVVPGGWAPDKLRRYDNVKSFVQKMNDQKKIIAMICHGGLVGISANIVRGHKATGSLGIKDDMINAGAEWVDQAAVRSRNLVFGRVVPDTPWFCKELIKALAE